MNNHRHLSIEQTEKNNKFHQIFQTLFFFLGLAFLAYLIYRMGLGTILQNISRVGPWFTVICVLGGIWLFLQAIAWREILRRDFQPVPLWFLFKVKIISDAINTILPSANLGGETTRAYLTRRYLSLKESLAGIIVDKTYELAGSILFMILGFTLAFAGSIFPKSLILPAILCLVIISIGIFLFIGFQLRGIYKILLRFFGFIPLINRFLLSKETQIQNLEQLLKKLYRAPWQRASLVLGLHFAARITGAVEALVILRLLDIPVSFIEALFIIAMVAGINTIFFLIPGQWGIAEGAHVFILQAMGFPPEIGLSLGIIKRIRKLFFAGLGFLFLLFQQSRRQ